MKRIFPSATRRRAPHACVLFLGLAACGDANAPAASQRAALAAECVPSQALPPGAFRCGETRTVSCDDGHGGATLPTLYVEEGANVSCADGPFTAASATSYGVGTHTVVVSDASGATACTAGLTVVDDGAPVLTPRTSYLWPPNHKFHSIDVADCVTVTDRCDASLKAEFIWASSDEPVDDLGDGHFAPDIQLDADCQHLLLRAERQGPKDGRVYKLGVRVVDAGGHTVESECAVIVDHDQRGVVGADSGESYRIRFDGAAGQPLCEGVTEPPVTEPPVTEPPATEPPVTPPATEPPATYVP